MVQDAVECCWRQKAFLADSKRIARVMMRSCVLTVGSPNHSAPALCWSPRRLPLHAMGPDHFLPQIPVRHFSINNARKGCFWSSGLSAEFWVRDIKHSILHGSRITKTAFGPYTAIFLGRTANASDPRTLGHRRCEERQTAYGAFELHVLPTAIIINYILTLQERLDCEQ